MEDGNSRNGYHKVKCQVPETEELQRRENRRENKWTINPKISHDKKEVFKVIHVVLNLKHRLKKLNTIK